MIKKGLCAFVSIGLFALVFLGPQSALAQDVNVKPAKFKVSSAFPPPGASMVSEVMMFWQQEVTKRTKGAITFETFWGGALGVPAEHVELIKRGTADVAQADEWYTPGRFPLSEFEFIFPFGPTDPVLMGKAMRKILEEFPEFKRDETREKVVLIAFAPGGEYMFLSKKPLRSVNDFKGEKVSLIGRYLGKWMPPGASAVVRPGQERYDLLRTGVVNIDLLTYDLHHAFKTYEQTKYCVKARILSPCFGTVLMSLDTFNRYPPEVQKIFMEAGKQAEINQATNVSPKWWERIQKEWAAKGIEFIDFPEAERQKWVDSLSDIPAEWANDFEAKGYPAFKMVQRWQEITSELGFKWIRKWGIKK